MTTSLHRKPGDVMFAILRKLAASLRMPSAIQNASAAGIETRQDCKTGCGMWSPLALSGKIAVLDAAELLLGLLGIPLRCL